MNRKQSGARAQIHAPVVSWNSPSVAAQGVRLLLGTLATEVWFRPWKVSFFLSPDTSLVRAPSPPPPNPPFLPLDVPTFRSRFRCPAVHVEQCCPALHSSRRRLGSRTP